MTANDKTVRAPKNSVSVVAEPIFRLDVVEGPDRGQSFVLDGTQAPRLLLGTSPACELRLGDRQVSRRHLSLTAEGGALQVRDLGSTNGTTANGVRIFEAALRGGEVLQVGETKLHVERGADEGETLVSDETGFGRYLGQSVAMRRLYPSCRKLAAVAVPLVIEGETGTGKELLAEAIHESGPRASGPFVVFDCAGVPAADMDRVLFGDENGLVEEAHGGTLLLDEIAELALEVQPKLLRFIERGEVRTRAGVRAVDVRIIATTRRDLDQEVTQGRFREDLFFRIAVTRLELAPLRARREDVAFLAASFWKALGTGAPFPAGTLERLHGYAWPGNVRELSNVVTRLATLGDEPRTTPAAESLPHEPGEDPIARVIAEQLPLGRAREKVIDEFERRYVEDAFVRNGSNVTKAAAASGIARRYFRALRARQR